MRSTRDLFDLSGRVALVTGGAGHIGSAMAEALAEWRAGIAVLDRAGVAAIPDGAIYLHCNITDEYSIHRAVTQLMDWYGRLDILVNCAGLTSYPTGLDVPLAEQSLEAWDACMNVNLRAAFALSQTCAPMLAASGHGSIINVGSIYGLVGPDWRLYEGTGMGNSAAYAASKAGLVGLTRWLATTLGPQGVRVNCICPGGVWRNQDGEFQREYVRRVPLGRMATEEDMKGVTAWLASDASAYVTGQTIAIDGGWTAW